MPWRRIGYDLLCIYGSRSIVEKESNMISVRVCVETKNKQVEPCCWMTYTVHRDTQVIVLFVANVIESAGPTAAIVFRQ